ncbi:hypothetical protein C8A01DRAFT_41001, partial [Parachaetomium inaequale]
MASMGPEVGNTVIIGIDFGTTYSGVAFTCSKKIDSIEVIASWDSELPSNCDEDKTPTAISFGPQNQVTWGYNIPFDAEQAKWFKLLLIDDKDLPDEVRGSDKIREARAYLEKHNITTAGDTFVVADCGGGTADIISYEVVTISPMVVRNASKAR